MSSVQKYDDCSGKLQGWIPYDMGHTCLQRRKRVLDTPPFQGLCKSLLRPAILIMAEDRLKAVHQRAEKYRIPALVYRL